MNVAYNIVVWLYYVAIKTAALCNPKAKLWVDGRKDWYQNLSNKISTKGEWIWVHCASLGEFEDCAEVISGIRQRNISSQLLLTFFSPSGVGATKDLGVADHITYLPLDTRSNAKSFLYLVNPKLVLFSRSELWYNFLSEITKREIPAFLISALVHPSSSFIKWPQNIVYKKCYNSFTQIYCQNNQTKELLETHFKNNKCSVTGNSRIDRIQKSLKEKVYPDVSKFIGNSFSVIIGSWMDKDEKLIISTIQKLKHLNIKWIIVPHEIIEKRINKQVRRHNDIFIRYSNIGSLTDEHSVIYIDFVGGLKHLYGYGDIAVIGGGFNRIGIHNIIEPTFHGVPTTFGPNHRDYPEVLDCIDLGYSTIHHNQIELQKIIEHYYHNPIDALTKDKIKQYAISKTGASPRIVADIGSRMDN